MEDAKYVFKMQSHVICIWAIPCLVINKCYILWYLLQYTWLPFENAVIFSFHFGSVNTSRLDPSTKIMWHISVSDNKNLKFGLLHYKSYVHMYCRGYETLSFRSSKFRNYDPLTTTRVHTQFNYTANFERIMLSWLIPEVDM